MAKNEILASAHSQAIKNLSSSRILLAGEPVFASLTPTAPDGFAQQLQIEATGGLAAFTQVTRKSKKIYVSVDERLFEAKRRRFAFAVEGYIAWGLKRRRKGTTILFGGAGTASSTSVTILVFADGAVVEIDERILPATTASGFRDSQSAMVAELRGKYPNAQTFQAAPLEDWKLPEIEFVGEAALRGASYRPLVRGFSKASAFVLPAAIAIFSLVIFAGALGVGWNKYSSSVAEYQATINDPVIKSQGGIDTKFINVVTARRVYMEEPRRQSILAEKADALVRGVGSVSGIRIMELRLPAPSINPNNQAGVTISPAQAKQRQQITPERTPDVWLSVAVPKTGDAAINQAKAVMTQIADNTGMSLRLAHQGWRDEQSRRIFNIEGFMHD